MKTKIAKAYIIQEDRGVLLRTGGPGSIIVTADSEPEPVEIDSFEETARHIGKRRLKPIEQLRVRSQSGEVDNEATEAAIQSHYADHYAVLESLAVPWEVGLACKRGQAEPVRYDGVLYNVIQGRTTQRDWTPDVTPALFAEIPAPAASGYPVWYQPAGAHDAWALGAKCEWPEGGQVWESTVPDNVWEPGVYGWIKIKDL
jgi:hypothetical protein